jgi:hypothetical protein
MDAYHRLRERARQLFHENSAVQYPYFDRDIVLNAEGLHHLRYSANRERSKPELKLKFRLLPLALEVIRKSGTVQGIGASGSRSAKLARTACASERS